ncbi:class I SAM-dependent methyltransferase [Labedaea rhizosphaerae]|nr:class I SAM-dependent methyltransferase [Labedaea rhizosphaerae]
MANDPDLLARRASSFGEVAREYAEHRPDYPPYGIAWALAGCAHAVRDVLDLAAGTGALTRGLVATGHRITAVEPDDQMRAELSRRVPEVPALAGTAEEIPLPDNSTDAVMVGQAFHWFDPERALTEIARVLRPGGALGLLWNGEDDSVGWVRELVRLNTSSVSRKSRTMNELPTHPSFGAFEERAFPHSQRRTAESLTATIGTHSHTTVATAQERTEVLSRVRSFLDTNPATAEGEFDLPLRTLVARATHHP